MHIAHYLLSVFRVICTNIYTISFICILCSCKQASKQVSNLSLKLSMQMTLCNVKVQPALDDINSRQWQNAQTQYSVRCYCNFFRSNSSVWLNRLRWFSPIWWDDTTNVRTMQLVCKCGENCSFVSRIHRLNSLFDFLTPLIVIKWKCHKPPKNESKPLQAKKASRPYMTNPVHMPCAPKHISLTKPEIRDLSTGH